MSREAFLEALPLVRATGTASIFQVRGVEIGGVDPVIIAGPCAVESEAQILAVARFVKERGAHGLRGGVYKPRSSPYSFQGLGREGLAYLEQARRETGLFLTIEVTCDAQIAEVEDYADILQIGARNMQNFELLKAVGRSGKPVILKRGLSATIQELLQAAEYILNEGNQRVILCERGIRTFETITRSTLDINAIPLLKKLSHLPVFADPSHGTGRRDLVAPVAKAALSAGADGLIIEVHPEPDAALSDGQQSLDFPEFAALMRNLPVRRLPRPEEQEIRTDPDFAAFQKNAKSGEARYIPVHHELIVDTETPVTAFLKLAEGSNRFLLESVDRGEQVGRYSFIGWDPLLTVKASGRRVTVERKGLASESIEGDPLRILEAELEQLKVAPAPELGNFYGGAVGLIGYDYVRQIEALPDTKPSTIGMPDFYWIVPRFLTCFDHVQHKIVNIVLTNCSGGDLEQAYQEARAELARAAAKLQRELYLPPIPDAHEARSPVGQSFSMTKEDYMERVERIKEYIFAGDAFQVVLSQRIAQPYPGDPFLFYRLLRTINPSPYLFYLDFGQFQVAGSSPEVMVRLEGETVTLKPIAGTRPRGKTPAEDEKLKRELLNDAKERAEHIMLVDLGRNDLGRVCRFGTVEVHDLMSVENYSHVIHIVSTVRGELAPGYSGIDVLRASFPAGTLSGAPKVRAMEIIEELEPVRREFYGGAIGYIGFNRNLDTCITIRTALFKENTAYLQVGAGIVADSVPETEYQETMNKAGAMLMALARAGEAQ
jgi:anthranilate synthase component 1